MAVHGGWGLQRNAEKEQSAAWDAASWVLLLLILVLVALTFRDYGISWDEQGQNTYGKLLLDYYLSGFKDVRAFSFANLYYYGGSFDIVAAVLNRFLPFGEYETRHLLGGLVGVLGFLGVWKLGRELGGPRTGFIALILLATTARFYGHTFTNPKDIPFAVALIWTLLYLIRSVNEVPDIRLSTALKLGLAFGLALGTRVGAVIIAPSFLLPFFLRMVGRLLDGVWPAEACWEAIASLLRLIPAAITAYLVMIACWPWAAQNLANPIVAMKMFSHFPFTGKVPFEGELIPAMNLPSDYLPDLLFLGLPPTLLGGLAVALLVGGAALLIKREALLEPRSLGILAVLLAAAVPIVYFVVETPPAYNGFRHFLFVIPPLAVLAALGLNLLLELPSPMSTLTALLLAAGIAWQVSVMVRLHPEEYVYFNIFAGGPAGAQGRYEVEYWGTSLRETTKDMVDLLQRTEGVPATPLKVYVCADTTSAAYYFPPWLVPVRDKNEADLQVALNQFYCSSPPGSHRLVETRRMGALLSYADDLRGARRN
ncbi:hypothetical protein dsx2_2026 [Desulfovibrio sp. X2]|uniref:glycosyltransferase family 39 protein n=1 Tax=Desulfovibrio sp. X2 TaxID=941449 RepID=UPI000358876F|nr:glycosyltransferase family 39 protein [Desulfovibrio sp. X2]EPR43916.1 hypothetical protein dsx2_2026 [Desulfovibrio sp. X2]